MNFLVDARGHSRDFSAYVVGLRFSPDGATVAAALGDGTLRLIPTAGGPGREIAVHDGAAMALAPHPAGGFVTGGDDGRLCRVTPDGAVGEIARFGSKWVEQVAAHDAGVIACGIGKAVHLFDATGVALKTLAHPSTVTGIAFDAKGKKVGASHYNGASLWFVASRSETPRALEWKGSHTGIAISPDNDSVVTTMQENALHGWRLSDGQHMRMSGYPAKSRSVSFSRTGKWLATAGADSIVIWPFFGGGPMGKAPTELAGGDGVLCQAVAFGPKDDVCAGGFSDGLVVVVDPTRSQVIPVSPPGAGPVSALAWSADGVETRDRRGDRVLRGCRLFATGGLRSLTVANDDGISNARTKDVRPTPR